MWLNIAAKLVPGMIKTGMSIAANRRKAKELESVAEMNHAQRMADGQIEYKKAVMNNQNQGWKDELVLIIVVLPIVVLSWSVFSGDPQAKEKLDLFFEYFNNFPEFYKWLVLGIILFTHQFLGDLLFTNAGVYCRLFNLKSLRFTLYLSKALVQNISLKGHLVLN